jgi:hypothetical protein
MNVLRKERSIASEVTGDQRAWVGLYVLALRSFPGGGGVWSSECCEWEAEDVPIDWWLVGANAVGRSGWMSSVTVETRRVANCDRSSSRGERRRVPCARKI